jgi:hypothetical protein
VPPRGRPTLYQPIYAEQTLKLCKLGADDAELANFFGVTETTINRWKHTHPDFCESLREGKNLADANVADRLYQRAMGYSHDAVKIVADANTGNDHSVMYTEHYPPDTTACIFWLKNRRSDRWRDRQEISHSGSIDLADKLAKARERAKTEP